MTDKIEELNKRLREVKESFETLRKSGIDSDILITYLQAKTKLGRAKCESFLNHLEDFYNGLIKQSVLDQFEKEGEK